jgi:pimeloyl-ACP methyl ester carboxylesterase
MATSRTASTRRRLHLACSAITVVVLVAVAPATQAEAPKPARQHAGTAATAPDNFDRSVSKESVREWTIEYRSHTGAMRAASILLPAWYGPGNNPVLPVVISPHGRGATGHSNATFFGHLPAVGRFAVISPDGMGRRLKNFSYGAPGQIDDLARMPAFATRALPWLRLDRARVYALGSSMGGQETLLLVARYNTLLAGAAALDSPTDLARRYRDFARLSNGRSLQALARREIGGVPESYPGAYARRSPINSARAIAFSRVPLQIFWSLADEVVLDQAHNSALLFQRIKELNPSAPVTAVTGSWTHSAGMPVNLPRALRRFGLLPPNV